MKIFYAMISFLFLTSLYADNSPQDRKVELKKQIEDLTTQKKYLESRIKRFEDKGAYLQFKEGKLQESKQFFKMADVFREKVKEIDTQIQTKEAELKKLNQHSQVSSFWI